MTKLLKILEQLPIVVISIILLCIMHISIPNMGGTVAHPREYFIWFGLFTLTLLSVIHSIINKSFILPSYLKYFIAYAVLILSTSIFNPPINFDIFTINILRLVGVLIIWLGIHQFDFNKKAKDNILLIITASCVIESIMIMLKFFVNSYYIHSFGITFAMKIIALTKYIPDVGGAFQQKNLFASWTATGIAISLYFITTERFNKYKKIKKFFLYFSLFILAVGLMLASSRAGLVGAALAMMVLLPTNWRAYSGIRKHLAIWVLVVAVGMSSGLYLISTKSGGAGSIESTETAAKEKVNWLTNTGQRSFYERLIMYDTSYEMFKDKPLFGQGFSNFGSTFMFYKADVSKDNPRYKGMVYNEFISHPHNELLYILSECGIAGILAVMIALFGIWKILRGIGIGQAGISIALFMPLLLHMMVEYPLKLSSAHTFLFILILYLLTSQNKKRVGLEKLSKPLSLAVVLIAVLLYAGIAGYTIKTFDDYIKYNNFKLVYMNTSLITVEDILPAVNNIYLRNWAEPDYMYRKALEAAYTDNMDMEFLNKFLAWNELEKKRRPGLPSFHLEGLIYLKMGRLNIGNPLTYFEKARIATEEGLNLYPNDVNLTSLRQEIISTAIGGFTR